MSRGYFYKWHTQFDRIIDNARKGKHRSSEIYLVRPVIEAIDQEKVILSFSIHVRSTDWGTRVYVIYPDRQAECVVERGENTLLLFFAESPLEPGLHINAYGAALPVLSIQNSATVHVKIKRDQWDRLANPFECLIVIGYNTIPLIQNPLYKNDSPTGYRSGHPELDQIIDWQKLAAFVFTLHK